MNRTFESLADICRDKKLVEKVLVVPTHGIGHQISESLVLQGVNIANLRIATLLDLALDAVNDKLSQDGWTLVSSGTRLSIVEEIFQDVLCGKEGLYFGELEPGPGIVAALCGALNDLRSAAVEPRDLNPSSFISPEKHKGFSLLAQTYEEYLAKNNLIDEAGVYRLALSSVNPSAHGRPVYIVHPRLPVSALSYKFFLEFTKKEFMVLSIDLLPGIEPPRHFPFWKSTNGYTGGRFSWIFQPEKCPSSISPQPVELFHSVGSANEVKEVLRRVMYRNLAFDSVEIACVDYDRYASLLFLEQQKQGLNLTYAEGIPCIYAAPGRALLDFVDWIDLDFPVTGLRHLIAANVLMKPEMNGRPSVSGQEVIRILREAKIGWGRSRYESLLTLLLKETEKKAGAAESDEGNFRPPDWYLEKAGYIAWVLDFIHGLLRCVPEPDAAGAVSVRAFADGLYKFLKDFTSRSEDFNRAAYATLLEMLSEVSSVGARSADLALLCKKVRNQIQDLHIGASSPKPGHIHVAPYGKAGFCGRPNNFVVGLDEHSFPGASMEDPVLLDEERKKISEGLILSTERFDARLITMYSYLASVRGGLTLSYTSYNIEEGREVFPSPVLLKVHRLVSGDHTADFTSLIKALGEPVSFATEEPIDETEWWLARSLPQSGSPDLRRKVLKAFPALEQGLVAQEARAGDRFTEFDGWVTSIQAGEDPRRNEKLVLSSSRIEELAKCPFQYFVKSVLGLNPMEDMEYEPAAWLSPEERGSLLHSIYERFMRTVVSNKEKVGRAEHRSLLVGIAEEEIKTKKEQIPPPTENVFDSEKQDILSSLEIFLKMEEARSEDVKPRFFELSFGLRGSSSGAVGSPEPVRVKIGEAGFFLRGKIDRIDELSNNNYAVIDYKTGGDYGFTGQGYFEKGTRIQHCLYARAAEVVLREQVDKLAKVTIGGYYFPTRRGKANLYLKPQNRPGEVDQVLNTILDIIKAGVFLPAAGGCFLCDQYELCGDSKEPREAKIDNQANKELDPIRKLENYG